VSSAIGCCARLLWTSHARCLSVQGSRNGADNDTDNDNSSNGADGDAEGSDDGNDTALLEGPLQRLVSPFILACLVCTNGIICSGRIWMSDHLDTSLRCAIGLYDARGHPAHVALEE
jgi:hypothetical protein